MAKSRFEQHKQSRASRQFTDREGPMRTFFGVLAETKNDNPYVVSFYGVGGVGKTRLCNEFKKRVETMPEPSHRTTSIDFGLPALREPTEALLFIRRQLSFDCTLFDFSMIRYWSLLGRPLNELNTKLNDPGGGLVLDVINHGVKAGADFVSLGSIIPSFDLLVKVVKSLKRKWKISQKEFEDFADQISNLQVIQLLERLPYYLGKDISRNSREKNTLLFIDTYEHLWLDSNNKLKPNDSYTDQWVRDLVASSPGLIVFIFSRRKLNWEKLDHEGWSAVFEEHLLGELSVEDSKKFLNSIPITDVSIADHIVQISGGLPFILDICVDIYLERIRSGVNPSTADFGATRKQVIEIALKDLSLAERETVRLLSVPRVVDRKLFMHLIKDFETGYPRTAYDRMFHNILFQGTSSVEKLRLHDLTREHILEDMDTVLKQEIKESVISHFTNREITSADERIYVAGEILHAIDPLKETHYTVYFKIIRPLLDRGMFLPVKLAIDESLGASNLYNSEFISVIRAVIERRIGNANKALNIFEHLNWSELSDALVGFASFEYGDACRVAGNLNMAEKLYSKVAVMKNVLKQDKYRAVRQYADLLMLNGHFCKALDILLDQTRKEKKTVDLANSYRQIGHIYRFNLDFDTAGEYYKKAYKLAVDADDLALQGKLLTNTIENNIFSFSTISNPYQKSSLSLNNDLANIIEIGKSQLALGVINILTHRDVSKGFKELNSAYINFIKAGYDTGMVVLLAYSSLCAHVVGSNQAYLCLKEAFFRQSSNIRGYLFLNWVVNISNQEIIENLENKFQWLNWNKSFKVICNIEKNLPKSLNKPEYTELALRLSQNLCNIK